MDVNATKEFGKNSREGNLFDGLTYTPRREDYAIIWYPEDLGYSELSAYAKDEFGNVYFSESTTIKVTEMGTSNVTARFVGPISEAFPANVSILSIFVEANSIHGILNVELFINGRSIGF